MTKNSTNMGRQKIAMVKIANKNNLQVTFSKRRTGLFKKASELCTLCGVEVAIIVFSPAKKVFSFGHPQVESIADRYLIRNHHHPPLGNSTTTLQLVEAHRKANIHELNLQLTQLNEQLEFEKRKGEALDKIRKAGQNQFWWQAPIDELGLNELERLRIALEELKKNVEKQANKVLIESANNHWQFLAANSVGEVYPFENKINAYGYGHGLF